MMTLDQHKRVAHLLKLADVAQEFEFVDLKLVNHFSYMREELGLAKLLLLIQEYATENKPQTTTETPETTNPNQNAPMVQ
jgi:hypothetical protein